MEHGNKIMARAGKTICRNCARPRTLHCISPLAHINHNSFPGDSEWHWGSAH